MYNFLLALTENDKRFIIALVFVLIVIIAFAVCVALLIEKIVKLQAKKLDKLMHDTVVTGVITNAKQFRKVANYKNRVQFYFDARIPFTIIIASLIVALITMGIENNWNFAGLFTDYGTLVEGTTNSYKGGNGFATILYLWDYSKAPTANFFGITLISGWAPLLQAPHFEVQAIGSYIFAPAFVIGLGWYMFTIQGFLARKYRLLKLSISIYEKNLDNVKFDNLANFKSNNGAVTYAVTTEPKAVGETKQNEKTEA